MQWCNNVDVIRPTPPTGIAEHPERTRDFLSNAPIPEPCTKNDISNTGSTQFDFDPSNVDPHSTLTKRRRGHPRKNNPPGPSNQTQPKHGKGHPCKSQPPVDQCNTSPKPQVTHTSQTQPLESVPKHGRGRPPKRANRDCSGQPSRKMPKLSTPSSIPSNGPSTNSNITSACVQLHLRVQQLLGTSPESMLSSDFIELCTMCIIDSFNSINEAIKAIAEAVNSL